MKVLLLLSTCLLISCSCVSKNEIEAALWMNNGLPKEVCERYPELNNERGLYRKLNDGTFELMSFCNPLVKEYFSIRKDEYQALIKKAYERKSN